MGGALQLKSTVKPVFAEPCTMRNPVLTGQNVMQHSAVDHKCASLDQAESYHIRTVSAAPRAFRLGQVSVYLKYNHLHP